MRDLVPFAGNARTHPEHQIEQICQSILRFGFYNPVITDERNNIIAGHGRVLAAQRLEMQTIPVIMIEGLSDNERRALVLADNRIALSASWDLQKVREELSDLAAEDFDLEITGFSFEEIDNLLRDDMDLLPVGIESNYVPLVPVQQTAPPAAQRPSASDDNHSRFELVMLHDNKVLLIDVLSQIKEEKELEKLEDALMELVKFWKENQ